MNTDEGIDNERETNSLLNNSITDFMCKWEIY